MALLRGAVSEFVGDRFQTHFFSFHITPGPAMVLLTQTIGSCPVEPREVQVLQPS